MTTLILRERGPARDAELTEPVAAALRRSGAMTVQRLAGGQWRLRPRTKVGVVRAGDVTVWLHPKLPVRRLLFLLGYATNASWHDELVGMDTAEGIVPVLAHLFARHAEHATAPGLLQGYVERHDELTVIRGRVRDTDQLRVQHGIALPLLVRYDDLSPDIAENQLLRAATDRLLRLPAITTDDRRRLRRLHHRFADVTTLAPGNLPRWRPSRLNWRYHVALDLAAVILADQSPEAAPGDLRVDSLVVNMEKLFEDFITRAFTAALTASTGHCRSPDHHHLDRQGTVELKPDLVWYADGRPASVVDAKYKAEKPSGFPNADLYQLLAYCTVLGVTNGHLVYARGSAEPQVHEIANTAITVHTHSLDLDVEPDALLARIDHLAGVIADGSDISATSEQR